MREARTRREVGAVYGVHHLAYLLAPSSLTRGGLPGYRGISAATNPSARSVRGSSAINWLRPSKRSASVLAVRPVEDIRLFYLDPRQHAALCAERVSLTGEFLFLREQLFFALFARSCFRTSAVIPTADVAPTHHLEDLAVGRFLP
jgi:hypothetical protein